MTDKPCRSLELNLADYELALIEATDPPAIVSAGLWIKLTDGLSLGDVMAIEVGGGSYDGLEIEIQIRKGKPILSVYDYRDVPLPASGGNKLDEAEWAEREAVTERPAICIDLDSMAVATNNDADREVWAAATIKSRLEHRDKAAK